MSPSLLTAARASLPANAKPCQIAQQVARLAEAQWIADGRKSFEQMAVEAWPAALEGYEASQLARLGPQVVAQIEAARAQPQEQEAV